MGTLYDIFKYNGLPYSDITDQKHKKIIEKIVEKIKSDGFENSILQYHDNYYHISDNLQTACTFIIDTNFDNDLQNEIGKAHIYARDSS